MRLSTAYRDERGFTIQELLVVLLVGSLLVSLTLSTFLFAGKLLHSWQRRSEIRSTVFRIAHTIAQDISQARDVTSFSDTALNIEMKNGKEVRYRFTTREILRNTISLTSPDNEDIYRVNISESTEKLGSVTDQAIKIHVICISKEHQFSVETNASISLSSREQFTRTMAQVLR
jgi:prepilin-type N-terminal cleavage/methylation domain-containing protein